MIDNQFIERDATQAFVVNGCLMGFVSFFFYILVSYGPFGLYINIVLWLIQGGISRYSFLYAFPHLQVGNRFRFNLIIYSGILLGFAIHWLLYFLAVVVPTDTPPLRALAGSLLPAIFALAVTLFSHGRLVRKYSRKRKLKNRLEKEIVLQQQLEDTFEEVSSLTNDLTSESKNHYKHKK